MTLLCSLSDMKTFQGIPAADTTFDAFYNYACATVDTIIRKDLNLMVIEQTQVTEILNGNNKRWIQLTHLPVQSIQSVYQDDQAAAGQGPDDFDPATTLLTPGIDYYLEPGQFRDEHGVIQNWSIRGRLFAIDDVWNDVAIRTPGLLAGSREPGSGNIKVTYTAGFTSSPTAIPLDLNQAAVLVIAQLKNARSQGWPLTTEHLSNYGYSLQLAAGEMLRVGEVASILGRYRRLL